MKLITLTVTPYELAELQQGLDAAAVYDAAGGFLARGDFDALRDKLLVASIHAMDPADRAAMEAELEG